MTTNRKHSAGQTIWQSPIFMLVAVAAFTAGLATATQAQPDRDRQLEGEVARQIRRAELGGQSRILVLATDDGIFLLGTVPSEERRQRVVQAAERVSGVDRVQDFLVVREQRRDVSDRRLRRSIQQQLGRMQGTHPQAIRVRVEDGTVRLQGRSQDWQQVAQVAQAAFRAGAQYVLNELSVGDQPYDRTRFPREQRRYDREGAQDTRYRARRQEYEFEYDEAPDYRDDYDQPDEYELEFNAEDEYDRPYGFEPGYEFGYGAGGESGRGARRDYEFRGRRGFENGYESPEYDGNADTPYEGQRDWRRFDEDYEPESEYEFGVVDDEYGPDYGDFEGIGQVSPEDYDYDYDPGDSRALMRDRLDRERMYRRRPEGAPSYGYERMPSRRRQEMRSDRRPEPQYRRNSDQAYRHPPQARRTRERPGRQYGRPSPPGGRFQHRWVQSAEDRRLQQRAASQVQQALEGSEDVFVLVQNGQAFLYGRVRSERSKERAAERVEQMQEIERVRNRLIVGEYAAEPDSEIAQGIRDELWWSPFVDANGIDVDVSNGTATLSGTVDTFGALLAAVESAYEAGAESVESNIRVTAEPRREAFAQRQRGQDPQQPGRAEMTPADRFLSQRIQRRLREQLPEGAELEVTVQGDEAWIYGTVSNEESRREAARIVRGTPGIREVHNQVSFVGMAERRRFYQPYGYVPGEYDEVDGGSSGQGERAGGQAEGE